MSSECVPLSALISLCSGTDRSGGSTPAGGDAFFPNMAAIEDLSATLPNSHVLLQHSLLTASGSTNERYALILLQVSEVKGNMHLLLGSVLKSLVRLRRQIPCLPNLLAQSQSLRLIVCQRTSRGTLSKELWDPSSSRPFAPAQQPGPAAMPFSREDARL